MISAPGVGSGLDINSLVTQLMAAERQPLNALTKQGKAHKDKLSAFGQVRSALDTLQTALKSLSTGTKFQALTATSSNTQVFSASAAGKATPASYQIEVQQLAQQHKLASTGFAAADTTIGSGTLTIEFGSYDGAGNTFAGNAAKPAQTITIDPANNTLAGIRDAINAAKASVTATLVNDGSAAGSRLVLTSTDSGTANSLKISVADDDGNAIDASGLSALAYDPTAAAGSGKNLEQVAAARDALLNIDGIAVRHPSNTVSNAIDGVTLTLAQTSAGQPQTLNVGRDSKSVTEAVQAFVDAYNSANGTLKKLSAFNGVGAQNGLLQGDGTTRAIQVRLRSLLSAPIDSGGALTTLSQIGVRFTSDGTLSLDTAKLNAAVETDFDGIAALFAKSATAAEGASTSHGYAHQIGQYLDSVLRDDGSLKARTEGIDASIKRLDKRQEQFEARLLQIEKRYRAQFTALDSMLSSMNATSAFLTQQLASLPGSNQNK